jgi:hypothetical protein
VASVTTHNTGMSSGNATFNECKRSREILNEDIEVSPLLTVGAEQLIVTFVCVNTFGGTCNVLAQLLFQALQQQLRTVGDPRSDAVVNCE